MFRTIQWKIVTIYLLLVLLAMTIVGVFIKEQFKQYHEDNILDSLKNKSESIAQALRPNWDNNDEVKILVEKFSTGFTEDIYILDENSNVLAGGALRGLDDLSGKRGGDFLSLELMLKALAGEKVYSINYDGNKRVKDYVMSVKHNQETRLIYLRADLKSLDNTLEQVRRIMTSATILALLITAVLSFVLARSITGPIKDVTKKAEKMASGHFEQRVEVKSNDEIGQLASMFNILTLKLRETLTEMSNEKSKMETIFTYMADGLIAINNEGIVIHANPAALDMLEIKDKEVTNCNFAQVLGEVSCASDMEQILRENNQKVGSRIIEFNDKALRAHYAPFKVQKETFDGVILVLQDITDQQKLENMRKEFVANVSHELRTPLTSIKSYTETLLDGAIDERELALEFLNVIYSESDRMARLVRDLLQLSRLDYHQTQWNMKTVALDEIVSNAVGKLKIGAKEKAQKLNLEIEEGVAEVTGDKDRLEQVIINVLSNAIKYTPENGEIIVSVETTSIKSTQYTTVKVQDNGIGIPKEDLPRIFERFYRVDKARSREMGGTGLGLSIAKQIVEAHNGIISIDSEPGRGTLVTLALRCN